MVRVIIRIDIDQIVEIGEHCSEVGGQYGQVYRGRPQYVYTYINDFKKEHFRGMQNYRGQNFGGGYRGNENFGRGRSRSGKEYSGNFRRNDRSSNSR